MLIYFGVGDSFSISKAERHILLVFVFIPVFVFVLVFVGQASVSISKAEEHNGDDKAVYKPILSCLNSPPYVAKNPRQDNSKFRSHLIENHSEPKSLAPHPTRRYPIQSRHVHL